MFLNVEHKTRDETRRGTKIVHESASMTDCSGCTWGANEFKNFSNNHRTV